MTEMSVLSTVESVERRWALSLTLTLYGWLLTSALHWTLACDVMWFGSYSTEASVSSAAGLRVYFNIDSLWGNFISALRWQLAHAVAWFGSLLSRKTYSSLHVISYTISEFSVGFFEWTLVDS